MIEINTAEDIKLLKEMTKAFSDDVDTDSLVDNLGLKSLYESNEILEKKIDTLIEVGKSNLKVMDCILAAIQGLESKIGSIEIPEPIKEVEDKPKEKPKVRKSYAKKDNSIFEPYRAERKEYQMIELEGQNLYHCFTANSKNGIQKHLLPINVFELLVIAEFFSKGQRSITFKEAKDLCELFSITRPQFSKVYYNLTIGKFDYIFSKIDKMINDSVFTFKKSHIYRNNHDTNLDKKTYQELLSIYINGGNSFLTILKLIRENKDVDSYDMLIMLKKSGHVTKILDEVDE